MKYFNIFATCMALTAFTVGISAADSSQLTHSFDNHNYPSTYNGKIAWSASDGNDDEIYYWDGKTITQITNNDQNDRDPSISANNGTIEIAWESNDGNDYEIYYYNGSTIIQVTSNNYDDIDPSLHDGEIAYTGWDGNDWEIYYWDGNNVDQITNNDVYDVYPSIYNSGIAWSVYDGNDYEIVYKLGNTVTTVTDNNNDDLYPSLYHGAIAWQGYDGQDYEIMYWDGNTITTVTSNFSGDYSPSLYLETIVWYGSDGNDNEIYYWDGADITKITNNNNNDNSPSFHDGLIAYRGLDAYGEYQIYHLEAPYDPNIPCEVNVTGVATDVRGRPTVGEDVVVTVQASSACRDDLYYEFYYRANYGTADYETSPWVKVQSYSTSNTATYSFDEPGSYIAVVRVVLDPNNEPEDLPIVGYVIAVE